MPTYLVTSGRDSNGLPLTYTVKADSFSADEHFINFKIGSVVVKAVQSWSIESIEMIDPPNGDKDE